MKETIIYGCKEGEPDYMETVLYDGGLLLSEVQIDLIKNTAQKDGFVNFRAWIFEHGSKPDFIGAIN